jgi:hypothetical protein
MSTTMALPPPPMARKVSCCSAVQSPSRVEEGFLPSDFVVTPYTVLCGRGRDCFESVGNRRFRILVQCQLGRYSLAETKAAKSRVVTDVVDAIRNAGGAFVKGKKGCWYEVGDAVAREKVGSLIRDFLFTRYRSSSKSKIARRQHRRNSLRSGQVESSNMDLDYVVPDYGEGWQDDEDDDALSLTSAASLVKSGCIGFRERRVSLEGPMSLIGCAMLSV